MNTKTLQCWDNDPKAEGLRIELTPDESLVLPHNLFLFAKLTGFEREQILKLVFAAHEVIIRGYDLRRIETLMHRMELSLVTVLPVNQRNFIPQGQPVILEISVKETERESGN